MRGEHDAAHRVVVARALERGEQVVEHLVGERVARLRLVERDRRDAGVGDLVAQRRVGHRRAIIAGRYVSPALAPGRGRRRVQHGGGAHDATKPVDDPAGDGRRQRRRGTGSDRCAQRAGGLTSVNASAKALRALALEGFDVTEARSGGKIEIVATSAKAAKLRARGVEAELKRNARGETATQFDARVQREDGSYDVYRPYYDDTYVGTDAQGAKRPTLYEEMVQLARDNPRIVKTVTIGRSLGGKPILALKVTRNARSRRDGSRPAVLYSATQHAREWITPEIGPPPRAHVVSSYGQDTEAGRRWTPIVDDHELWFVVVANPDGYDHSFTPGNRLWRKNLRDNNGDGQITDVDGVDPNRNFANEVGL